MSETEKEDTGPGEAPAPADAKPEEAASPDEARPAQDQAGSAEAAEAQEERDLETENADLSREVDELKDRLLRALAETENVRRRAQREREDAAKFAVTAFARDVLSVADNLQRALEAVPGEAPAGDDEEGGALASLVGGIELTGRELVSVLQRHGIEKIDAAGEKFDHNLHEAMFEMPTADAEPGTVVTVVQTGYVLNGRLLRAARVGVARALPEAEPDASPADTGSAG